MTGVGAVLREEMARDKARNVCSQQVRKDLRDLTSPFDTIFMMVVPGVMAGIETLAWEKFNQGSDKIARHNYKYNY